jgi:hypothetical protein
MKSDTPEYIDYQGRVIKDQKMLFEHIWETREHVSELTGKPLLPKGNFKWHWQFCHILPKGSYNYYKLNPENIILARPEEHEKQESFDKFNTLKENLIWKYYAEFYNKI